MFAIQYKAIDTSKNYDIGKFLLMQQFFIL